MTDVHLNNNIDRISNACEVTNREMVDIKASFETLFSSDCDIRIYYNQKGVNGLIHTFEPFKVIFTGFLERIPRSIESIDHLLAENNLTKTQIEILNKSKKLEIQSLKIIGEMQDFLEDIIHKVQQPDYTKLETLALEIVRKYKIQPKTYNEIAVLEQIAFIEQTSKNKIIGQKIK